MISHYIYPTLISACGVVLLAAYAISRNARERRKSRKELEGFLTTYPTASAGTPSKTIPAEQESISLKYTQFKDCTGNIINPADYLQFVVKGDSMQFCGIHDNDLIFVKKGFDLNQLSSFPTPVVIKRDNAPADETQYKVRREWGICSIDTCEDFITKILSSDEFKNKIAAINFYDGEEALLNDFRIERYGKYRDEYMCKNNADSKFDQVVISTTFHTNDNKIRFSIHPASNIIGIISDSFSI